MKTRRVPVILMIVIACLPLIGLLVVCFGMPVYTETYYAAIEKQYDRLMSIKDTKVVLVGGSSVAFGIDCELFEELYEKPIVPLGLYGVFGIKLMLDLSKGNLKAGDTVVISNELTADSYTIRTNTEPYLKATEDRTDMLFKSNSADIDTVLKSLIPFAVTKQEYLLSGEYPQNEGVYKYESVNAYGEIEAGMRPGNIMRTGYLSEDILTDGDTIEEDFIDYINEFVAYCMNRGVNVLYSFPPINAKALEKQKITDDNLYALYDNLSERLDCKVISDPLRYVYDYRYFYDTNFHLNDSGVILRTVQLVRDLNLNDGNNSMLNVTLPQPPQPVVKTVDIDYSLNYTDSGLFRYMEEDGYLTITDVSDELADFTEIILPVEHDGKYITRVGANALSKCKNLTSVTVPVGISELISHCFIGCEKLTEIRILENNGANISVYDGTFDGVNYACRIVLVNGKKAEFALDYFWGRVTLPIEEAK